MARRVKDPGSISKKWVQRAGAAGGDYKDGVAASGGDWETNAAAGEQNYADGVQAAIGQKRFGAGIRKAGGAKFAARASSIGAQRYAPGVQAGADAYQAGATPYLQAGATMALPQRYPKGDPRNAARSQAVAQNFRAMKVGK